MTTTTMQESVTSDGNGTAVTGLTAPCVIQLSGNFNGAAVRFEASLDGGSTYSPISWIEAQNGPGFLKIDITGPTYAVRAPVYGVRSTHANTIKVVCGSA